ncbi:DUF805 domain-containing protein [Pseudomonas sp. GOM7]|uniref:DUF805 domain-containing protein n=1 Tax=Pseudomonas sp. GOM7 TaxID=2998079 RepID=UPI00227C1AD0|nr:DUF805 domain-containing protein [Pseudomonas sp. GOM7]WAJ38247.1 DUF805 domain-containing protein [Pseudomonas sp. GOM7]
MNPPRYKILFDGQLMPNATLETVKDNLARLFKSDRARIDALFSGAVVTLKKDLPEQQADQYLDALQKAGAKVRKELDQAIGLSLVQTEDHPEEPAPDTASQARMTCPKCGHEQTKAAECSACGIIIEKYMARQAQLAATTVTPVQEASSPYAPPRADVAENLPQFGELKVVNVAGRIGRVRYLGWSMAMMLCAFPVLLLSVGIGTLSSTLSMLLVAVAVLGMAVIGVCIGVQRLHDIGWSGWLWLVNFVPVVGGVFSLLMLIIPGSQGANRYGPPPPPNSNAVVILAWLTLLLPVIGIAAAIALPQYMGYTEQQLLQR